MFKRLLQLVLLMAIPVYAQVTFTYPALSTPNVWTNSNTFTAPVIFNGSGMASCAVLTTVAGVLTCGGSTLAPTFTLTTTGTSGAASYSDGVINVPQYQAALGFTPAHGGANSDITSLSGLTTALSTGQGGTGATTAAVANLNITGVTQTGTLGTSSQVSTFPGTVAAGAPIALTSGGTGATTAAGALVNLGGLPLAGGTLTGNLNVAGTVAASTVNASTVDAIVSPCQFAGITADVQITAALATISSGGTVDARCFGATSQSIVSTVTVAAGETLLFDPATKIQPASSNLNMFDILQGGKLNGLWVDLSNLPANTFTGNVISFDTAISGTPANTAIDNVYVSGTTQMTGGNGINLVSASSSQPIAFVSLSHVHVFGLLNAVSFKLSGTGWINSNTFNDVQGLDSANGFVIYTTSSTPMLGNQFINCSYQMGTSGNAVVTSGTGQIAQNSFTNFNVWDTTGAAGHVAFVFNDTSTYGNYFQGRFDGTWADTSTGNTFIDAVHTANKFMGTTTLNGTTVLNGPVTLGGQVTSASGSYPVIQTGSGAAYDLNLKSASGANDLVVDTSGNFNFRGALNPGNYGKMIANCGTITTTAAPSDVLSCSWVTTSSNCTITPNNATEVVWTYFVPSAGSVTIYHIATAGATYAIACSTN